MTRDGFDATRAEAYDGSEISVRASVKEVGAKVQALPSWEGMAVNVEVPPGPERTRALLEEIAGGSRGAQLRTQVAARKRGATREQIEEAFQEACLKASRSCRGQTMGEVYRWLLKTTDSTVDDMRDRLKREVLVDHSAREFQAADPALAPPEEVLIGREDRAELERLTLSILERLGERERNVAVLHSRGFARNDIARRLGVTPRIVKRDMEGILATGREQLARVAGLGCPDGHGLISRYAFGLAAGDDARRAQLHLATCERCGAMFERLDLWRERVAALLPVPPAVEAKTDVVERVVHAGAEVLSSGQPSGGPAGLRRHASDAAAHLREHAAGLYYRTVDPTPLAGVRPGAVAAAVAGCLALGGGATYCVQEGANPLSPFSWPPAPAREEKKEPKSPRKRARAAQVPAPQATTPTVVVAPATQQTPTPSPPVTTTAAVPPPAPQDEYEPGPAAEAATATQAAAQDAARKPAPAPVEGPGEFNGP